MDGPLVTPPVGLPVLLNHLETELFDRARDTGHWQLHHFRQESHYCAQKETREKPLEVTANEAQRWLIRVAEGGQDRGRPDGEQMNQQLPLPSPRCPCPLPPALALSPLPLPSPDSELCSWNPTTALKVRRVLTHTEGRCSGPGPRSPGKPGSSAQMSPHLPGHRST